MNRLSLNDRARILHCLVEGNSMRATSRMCDVSINTVTKLLVDVGTACLKYQDQVMCVFQRNVDGVSAGSWTAFQRNVDGVSG